MKTLKLAVIGKDVSKSISPPAHLFISKKMGNKVEYDLKSIPESEFEGSIDEILREYDGFNVTIPYKLSIIPHLKSIEGDAKIFGAVNTVRTDNLSGYNTDGLGFMLMLSNNGVSTAGKTALVLGCGGAGRSVAKKLADGGASVTVYDKSEEAAKSVQSEFGLKAIAKLAPEKYDIIVNATGVGMHKTEGISPVGAEFLSLCQVAVDLIYTPKKSKFLEIAESCGKKIINGEAMLFYQAYFAECIYFGVKADELQAKRLFEEYSEDIK